MTGKKLKKIFEALVSESMHKDARNLVEYCCFRFLSRENTDVHPCLQVSIVDFTFGYFYFYCATYVICLLKS